MAERAGFEPANLFGLHAFQACALSQTTRPLRIEREIFYHNKMPASSRSPHAALATGSFFVSTGSSRGSSIFHRLAPR